MRDKHNSWRQGFDGRLVFRRRVMRLMLSLQVFAEVVGMPVYFADKEVEMVQVQSAKKHYRVSHIHVFIINGARFPPYRPWYTCGDFIACVSDG